MRWRATFALLLMPCTGAVAAASELTVRERQGRLDVAVKAAPLAEVLDQLARRTGMKVIYEGHAPRQLVTLTLAGRSPADVVQALLEGQGLNYALLMDSSATRVEKLLVTAPSATPRNAAPRSASRGVAPPTVE